jgi:thermitase
MKLHRIPVYFVFAVLFVAFAIIVRTSNGQGILGKAAMKEASPSEVIVKYKNGTPESEKQKIRSLRRAVIAGKIDKIRLEVVRVEDGKIAEAIAEYKKNPFVEYAEPNYKAEAFATTTDPSLPQQWGLYKIHAANPTQNSAWDITTGNPNIKIAVLDTGIEKTHADLAGKIIGEANFTTASSTNDANGHGTHVAGIAAAATNNVQGIAGAGYNTTILNGKVLGDDGSGYYSWIANGIIWAADQGAHVINMSLGGTASSQAMSDAVDYAWSKGAVIVAAAGNKSTSAPHYPAYYPKVVAVAATDNNDNKASFSNYDSSWVDVAAPGTSIYSTYKGNAYGSMSGTSMASPMVSGVAGLVYAKGACMTNICVRGQIEQTADQILGTGTLWRWGRINALRAVTETVSTSPTPTLAPTATPTPITPLPTPTSLPTSQPTPTSVAQNSMTVSELAMSYSLSTNNFKRISATVTIVNKNTTQPLASARVYATITSPAGKITNFSGYSNSSGKYTMSVRSRELGTYTTKITNVTRSGYVYSPTITTTSLAVQ